MDNLANAQELTKVSSRLLVLQTWTIAAGSTAHIADTLRQGFPSMLYLSVLVYAAETPVKDLEVYSHLVLFSYMEACFCELLCVLWLLSTPG